MVFLKVGDKMKKINVLKSTLDFNRIIKTTRPIKSKNYVIYFEYNTDSIYHFGISVSKKIGNAVTRNKYKRKIRSIISKKDYKNYFNCIIILRKSALECKYQELEDELLNNLKKVMK